MKTLALQWFTCKESHDACYCVWSQFFIEYMPAARLMFCISLKTSAFYSAFHSSLARASGALKNNCQSWKYWKVIVLVSYGNYRYTLACSCGLRWSEPAPAGHFGVLILCNAYSCGVWTTAACTPADVFDHTSNMYDIYPRGSAYTALIAQILYPTAWTQVTILHAGTAWEVLEWAPLHQIQTGRV